MEFEWDEEKRLANIAKHGIDVEEAETLFDGRLIFTKVLAWSDEERFATTGQLGVRYITAIWTWRGPRRRFISVRRAHDAEERTHRQLQQG